MSLAHDSSPALNIYDYTANPMERSNLECQQISFVFCENWVCANRTANGTSSNATGNVFGGNFPGRCPGVMYGGIVRAGKYPGEKTSREKCWDPHARLQLVCTCSGYDLCHHGYIAYRQTHSQIDSQTDGRTAFDRLYY